MDRIAPSEDTPQPLKNAYEDVPEMLDEVLKRSHTRKSLAIKSRKMIHLWENEEQHFIL